MFQSKKADSARGAAMVMAPPMQKQRARLLDSLSCCLGCGLDRITVFIILVDAGRRKETAWRRELWRSLRRRGRRTSATLGPSTNSDA